MQNKKKIEKLFMAHYGKMFRLARMILHDEEEARDTVYDVFESLFNVDIAEATARAYLLRCVRNSCIDRLHGKNMEERLRNLYLLEPQEYDDDWPDEETIGKLGRIIEEELTPQQQRVIRMRYAGEMKYREVAEELGISETAVARHIQKAFQKIRDKFVGL